MISTENQVPKIPAGHSHGLDHTHQGMSSRVVYERRSCLMVAVSFEVGALDDGGGVEIIVLAEHQKHLAP
ncbi:hypothetical protein PYCC9005_004648 [Savitreella phatthalungensis]